VRVAISTAAPDEDTHMADMPETGQNNTADEARSDHGSPPRMPGWVKWPAIIVGVLILLFVVLRFFGIEHGPGRHGPGNDSPPASVAPGGHVPGGGHG
jgi:hypothetical protein